MPDAELETAVQEALALLANPQWHQLFGDKSQAEVPVTGVIAGLVISARLDRLAVTDDTVWIADYKTNRPPPKDVSEIPRGYVQQMQSYRALIQQIFPAHEIRCLLIWTHTGTAMEVPKAMLDQEVSG